MTTTTNAPSIDLAPPRRWRRAAIVGGVVAASLLGAGFADAAIPDADTQVFHGCVDRQGRLRVIDTDAGQQCVPGRGGETAIQWNAEGPAGPAIEGIGDGTGGARAGNSGLPCTLGEVHLTAGTAGNGVPADGRLLPIMDNQALFALMGTTYGGDGATNFALPDLQDLAPDHMTYMICTQGSFPGF